MPSKEAGSPRGELAVVSQSGKEESATEEARAGETTTGGGAVAAPVEGSPEAASSNGLGRHGDPVEGQDESREEKTWSPPVGRAPRQPTPKEREVHEATHLPHAERCEFCMRGRARNKGHRRDGSGSRACAVPEHNIDEARPVPKVSLDFFFLGERHPRL